MVSPVRSCCAVLCCAALSVFIRGMTDAVPLTAFIICLHRCT